MATASATTETIPNGQGLVAESPPRIREWKSLGKSCYKLLSTWFIGPLLGYVIGTLIITRLIGALIGPSYSVYVVGPFGPNSQSDMRTVFNSAAKKLTWSVDGVPVRLHLQDDQGDPIVGGRIAADLAKRDDTLLVIGHFQSSTSKEALPLYLAARPPIPVILATETTANLLPPKSYPDQHYPVFSLAPNDDVQAQTAFTFAAEKGARNFWIVQDDMSNTVYSTYLAQQFMDLAQGQRTHVLLRTSPSLVMSSDAVNQLNVNWIFFAGTWRSALLFIRHLRATHINAAHILLSDGCATQDLLDAAGSELEGVYVTHPLDAKCFNEKHNAAFAENSLAVFDQLLDKANSEFSDAAVRYGGLSYRLHSLIGIHRVRDARNALIQAMQMTGTFSLRYGGAGSFDRDGMRVGAKFHVWQISHSKFVDVQ